MGLLGVTAATLVTLSKTDSQLDNSQSSRPIEHNAYKVYVDKTNVEILLSELDMTC